MTHGARVRILRHGHISHYSEYALTSTVSIYSTLIAIVLRDAYAIVDFYLFFVWAIDMQI